MTGTAEQAIAYLESVDDDLKARIKQLLAAAAWIETLDHSTMTAEDWQRVQALRDRVRDHIREAHEAAADIAALMG